MKLKRILVVVLIIIIVGSCNNYLDLMVSEKYETQFDGLASPEEQIEGSKELQKKIDFKKKVTIIIFFISIGLFYPVFLIKNKSRVLIL